MNKSGKSLRFALFFIILFIVGLVFATIGLNQLGLLNNSDDTDLFGNLKNTETYKQYESNVSKAALNYYNNNYTYSNDTIIINVETLYHNGYLSIMYDNNGNECIGYAKVFPNSNVKSYIKCGRYKTDGY